MIAAKDPIYSSHASAMRGALRGEIEKEMVHNHDAAQRNEITTLPMVMVLAMLFSK